MSATSLFSYHRLRNELDHKDIEQQEINQLKARTIRWPLRLKMKKRLKMKIPSMRRKARVVLVSLRKVLKRLKESQTHFGDLFAGNYLFLQVTPTIPLKSYSHAIGTREFTKKIEDRFC